MAFKSIGQKLGFVSAGDVRRARERAAEKRGREAERRKSIQEKLEAAREMLAEGLSSETVCRIQKLTPEQIRML